MSIVFNASPFCTYDPYVRTVIITPYVPALATMLIADTSSVFAGSCRRSIGAIYWHTQLEIPTATLHRLVCPLSPRCAHCTPQHSATRGSIWRALTCFHLGSDPGAYLSSSNTLLCFVVGLTCGEIDLLLSSCRIPFLVFFAGNFAG